MNKKKLGTLGKLSEFSGIKSTQSTEETNLKEGENPTSYHSADTVIELVETHGGNSSALLTVNGEEIPRIEQSSNGTIPVKKNPVVEKSVTKKKGRKTTKQSIKDKPVTINIKITKSQKEWLADTASRVRDNNQEPVPPSERVYPQHLVGVAISLLQESDVDWTKIKNETALREQLNL